MKENEIKYYVPGCAVTTIFCSAALSALLITSYLPKHEEDTLPLETPSISVTEVVRNENTGESILVEYASFDKGLRNNWGEYVVPVGFSCVDRYLSSFPGAQRTCVEEDVARVVTFNGVGCIVSTIEGSIDSEELVDYVERYNKDKALLEEAGF